ncbi:hypothetical protein NKR19_g3221 [Coniochaeta hoffmannii]|uniref:Uncharacterized protein n=1 Tax=Coniochaeta hoffmannii TaxID=91930 RepID=A0AA38S963_9PEZI|nr:hypothetical protein NKR19_g3221 [Coniochaeta hoffmannii]
MAKNTVPSASTIPWREEKEKRGSKTYNIRHSPVVTHPSTTLTITSLSLGERTGSRIFQYLWSYVTDHGSVAGYMLGE